MINHNITVVIPTFNRKHTIERAIQSVLSQTSQAYEIIIVDDASTDGTVELIKAQYPFVTLLINSVNSGVSYSRNRGIQNSTTDWIALLDSDDEWCPEKLKSQQSCLAESRDSLFCHTDEIWIRNGVRVNAHNKHKKYGGNIFERCLAMCLISPSSVVMHRSLFNDYGNFDENLPACEDYDLWLRITAHIPISFVEDKLVVKHGGHDDQLSQKHWGMDRFRVTSLRNLLIKGDLTHEQKKLTRDKLHKKLIILRNGAIKRNKTSEVEQWNQWLCENYSPTINEQKLC